ncbi:MAG: inner membrane CreD family protein [Candidatus Acidiferrales bacterium]
MIKRMAALTFIFVCTSIAWIILGETIVARTDSPMSSELKSRVAASWGTTQQQSAPTASYNHKVVTKVETDKGTKEVETTETVPLSVEASKIDVALNLKHRQKGLLWYSTYAVTFGGDYTFTNSSDQDRDVVFRLPFPASQAIYDDLVMSVDDQPLLVNNTSAGATGSAHIAAGKAVVLHTGYRSQGVDSWQYNFGEGISQIRNFTLHMRTNFKDIDFPENTMSPTTKSETGGGWDLVWSYKNLVAGYEIGMTMPEKLQPGPLAGQISYFAPISLFFFFFLMFIISTLRGIDLHPMNYFFFAAAFFSFHLLLAYLVDHISIHLTFLICSLVSTFLVVTYARLVVGMRFAALEAGLAQFIYLVLFSYAFFFKGFTGLAITIGSILTLFVVMQMTGRIRREDKFAKVRAGASA